jgi:exodeoxyribonuclease-3
MKIASWNVNSVRARIENVKKYLNQSQPDILLLQEIKAQEKDFPYEDFKKLGYISYVHGQKSYNGVSIISKKKLTEINTILTNDKIKQSRFISTKIKIKNQYIDLINIYVPNGNPVDTEKYFYKISWLDLLIKYLKKKIKDNNLLIVTGDFNIIPEDIDVNEPEKYTNDALFRIEIRKKFREIINLGLIDVFRNFNKKESNYTYWDYMKGSWEKNNGLRIDHILISSSLIDLVKKIDINAKIRSQTKPSDHVPIECTFS